MTSRRHDRRSAPPPPLREAERASPQTSEFHAPGPSTIVAAGTVDPRHRAPPPPVGRPGITFERGVDRRLCLLLDPSGPRALSFRTLRDNLIARRLPRILAVSSAVRAEGKTTCAANLALALSEEARVLLLDGNLLRPHLDQLFDMHAGTRPSTAHGSWAAPYLLADVSESLAVAAFILAPGVRPLFDRRWYERLLASLRRSHWDYMIFDAAGLLLDPTVLQLVSAADATLLTARAGMTTGRALRRAVEQLSRERLLGVTLVEIEPERAR